MTENSGRPRLGMGGLALLFLLPGAGAQLCGDCDRDGVIVILDALRASRIGVGLEPELPTDSLVCDVDLDTRIGILDAFRMAQEAVGLAPTLTCVATSSPLTLGVTPVAPFSSDISVDYILVDSESDLSTLLVEVSMDAGASFPIVASEGIGGDGTIGLSTSPTGEPHVYVWDSLADLGAIAVFDVVLRITASDAMAGTPGYSGLIVVDNRPPGLISWRIDLHPIILDTTPSWRGCVKCHAGSFPPADLDLETYASLMAGSASGPVVLAGDPDNSLMVCKIEGMMSCGQRMPLSGTPWTPGQVQMLRDWILQGAADN